MLNRKQLAFFIDCLPVRMVAAMVVGSTLAFGGAVWWARPVLAVGLTVVVIGVMVRAACRGSLTVLKSPLLALGACLLLVAILQLAPLPGGVARVISPHARMLYEYDHLPASALSNSTPDNVVAANGARSPASVDRAATLRWVLAALGCLVLFGAVSHDTDRLGRTYVLWGSVVGSLFLVTIIGWIQVLGGSDGKLYGLFHPGEAPSWAPSLADQLDVPGVYVLQPISDGSRDAQIWVVPRPRIPRAIGGLMGGSGSFLALTAIGLPLAVGLSLHGLAPRGSRETFWMRIRHTRRGGLIAFMFLLTILTAGLAGVLAGPILAVPITLGVLMAGLPGARSARVVWLGIALTVAILAALLAGVQLGKGFDRPEGGSPLVNADGWSLVRDTWGTAARVCRDFPILGSGLGSFTMIFPYYKEIPESTNTSWSGPLQFAVESGIVGMTLLALAVIICLWRLPRALRHVGSADRVLAFGLLGSVLSFTLFSLIHWTMGLTAVALAVCVVLGTFERWLSGGTDLFVERT